MSYKNTTSSRASNTGSPILPVGPARGTPAPGSASGRSISVRLVGTGRFRTRNRDQLWGDSRVRPKLSTPYVKLPWPAERPANNYDHAPRVYLSASVDHYTLTDTV